MALVEITGVWDDYTITGFNLVTVHKGPIYIAEAGTTDNNAGQKIGGEFFADDAVFAMRGPGWIDVSVWKDPRIPEAFIASNWGVADNATANRAVITVSALPTVYAGTITAIQYQHKLQSETTWGAWTNTGGTTATTYNVDGLANAAYDFRLRLVTTVGDGPAGNTEQVTVS